MFTWKRKHSWKLSTGNSIQRYTCQFGNQQTIAWYSSHWHQDASCPPPPNSECSKRGENNKWIIKQIHNNANKSPERVIINVEWSIIYSLVIHSNDEEKGRKLNDAREEDIKVSVSREMLYAECCTIVHTSWSEPEVDWLIMYCMLWCTCDLHQGGYWPGKEEDACDSTHSGGTE